VVRGAAGRAGGLDRSRARPILPSAYVGGRGWIAVRLDVDPDWDEIAGICEDAYRVIAPKTLVARLDAPDRDV
jgi:hypothetical protein